MNCRYIENNLIGYIENTLPQKTVQDIDFHLIECKACNHLVSKVKNTYNVFDSDIIPNPDLYTGIYRKLKGHHTTVIEFIPQHRILFRIAATVVLILGVGFGILLGGKFSSSDIADIQTVSNQSGLPEYYTIESNSMDSEPGLASLYANE